MYTTLYVIYYIKPHVSFPNDADAPFPPRTHIAKASKPPRIHLAKPSKKRLNSKCYQKYEKPNRFQRYDWALRIFPKRGRKKTQNRNVAMRQEKLIYSLFLTHRNVTILCFFLDTS